MAPDLPTTRKQARQQGSVSYFTGVACRFGHLEPRYTLTATCYACKRAQNKRDAKAHPVRTKERSQRDYKKHAAKYMKSRMLWAAKNREKSNDIKKRSKLKHHDKYKEKMAKWMREKCTSDPTFRLSCRVKKQIWDAIKKQKAGRHWEILVGYSLTDLINHLAVKFVGMMSLSNYGTVWELDHIVPVQWFLEKGLSADQLVKEAWNLKNLRPIWPDVNRGKCDLLTEEAITLITQIYPHLEKL